MAYEIHKARVREALPARMQEPYWGVPLGRGRALGYRKLATDRGSWIARRRPDGGDQKYEYKALGPATREFDYERAKEAAIEWFQGRDAGADSEVATVAEACREYVTDRCREKGDACAHDAEKRFERTVYDTPLAQSRCRNYERRASRNGGTLSDCRREPLIAP